MEFIKKHGIKILIVLLVMFSMNKCTVACNRDTKINKLQTEIVQKDSIINKQKEDLDVLKIRWADAMSNQSTYQGLALGTKKELLDSINILKSEKNLIYEKNRKLELEILNIKKENKQLKNQLK